MTNMFDQVVSDMQKEIILLKAEVAQFKKEKKQRWKPKDGESYYIINEFCEIEEEDYASSYNDYDFWEIGNCFITEKQAEQAVVLVKETLKKFHEDNPTTL